MNHQMRAGAVEIETGWVSWGMFWKKLLYWTFHVSICAAPSFWMAYDSEFSDPQCVAAMVTGVVIFVFAYAVFTSSLFYRKLTAHCIARKSVRRAMYLRTGTSIGTLLVMASSPSDLGMDGGVTALLVLPDFFAGLLAIMAVSSVLNAINSVLPISSSFLFGGTYSFFPTLLTVLVEGMILSAALVILCLAVTLVSNLIAGRKGGRSACR